jgi:hypothetical protein
MANFDDLGYDEVVDTICDVIDLGKNVKSVFADGFQVIPDLIALTPEFFKVQEIIGDAPLAINQLKNLSVEEAKKAHEAIAKRTGVAQDKVVSTVTGAFGIIVELYEVFAWNQAKFFTIKTKVQDLL